MSTLHSIRSLRSTLVLVEKRERLERQIQDINQQLHRALANQEPRKRSFGSVKVAPSSKRRNGKRGKRGAMKELILSVLQEAGEAGLAVKHLAQKIGAKPANVHAWFGSTGKKGGLTEAVGRGIYRLKRSMGVAGEARSLRAPKPKLRAKKVNKR